VSPDGRSVYVGGFGVFAGVSGNSGSIAVFSRSPTEGRIAQLSGTAGCLSATETECTMARGIEGTAAVVLSPDGRNLYATGLFHAAKIVVSPDGRNVYVLSGDALALFRRGAFGALAQLPGQAGCFSSDGSDGSCAASPLLEGGLGLAISPDGLNLYVTSYVS